MSVTYFYIEKLDELVDAKKGWIHGKANVMLSIGSR